MNSLSVRVLCISTLLLPALFPVRAENQSISRDQAEALVSGLKFQQCEITLNTAWPGCVRRVAFDFSMGRMPKLCW